MKNEKIVINGVNYVMEHKEVDLTKSEDGINSYLIGNYVVVRCKDAGVHAGYLIDYKERVAVLSKSKRLWYWKAAKNSFLSAVAVHGITDESKTGDVIETIILTETCEIIGCTEEARFKIQNAPIVPQG